MAEHPSGAGELPDDAHVTDGVERALGRQARDFTDYATAVAARDARAPARLPAG